MSNNFDPSHDDPHTYYAAAFGIGIIAAGVMTLLTFLAREAGWTNFDLAMTLYQPSCDGIDTGVGSAHLDVLIVDQRQYETIRFRRRRTEESAR